MIKIAKQKVITHELLKYDKKVFIFICEYENKTWFSYFFNAGSDYEEFIHFSITDEQVKKIVDYYVDELKNKKNDFNPLYPDELAKHLKLEEIFYEKVFFENKVCFVESYRKITFEELNDFNYWAMLLWDRIILIMSFHGIDCPCSVCNFDA